MVQHPQLLPQHRAVMWVSLYKSRDLNDRVCWVLTCQTHPSLLSKPCMPPALTSPMFLSHLHGLHGLVSCRLNTSQFIRLFPTLDIPQL